VSPTARSAAILAVLALAVLFVGPLIALLGAAALLAAMIVDAHAVARPPAVRVQIPEVLARGVSVRLEVEVAPGPQRHARIRQPVPAGCSIAPSEAAERLDATLTPTLRGRHTLAAPAVRLTGPLGLASWDHTIGAPRELVVYPDLPAARRLARSARSGSLGEPLRQRGPLGVGTEFELVRDHVDGDDVRQMNWLATARLDRPMTNQFRVESERDVLCLIDCGRLMAAPLGDRTRLDVALDATAAVLLSAEELGDRCGAIAFDAVVRHTIEPRHRSATNVMRTLFDLQTRTVECDYERAFGIASARKRAIVVLFTDLLDERAARAMVAAAAMLSRRHSVIVASPADPAIDELPDREPQLPLHVYASSVALDVLAQRAAAIARLRRHSDAIVNAPPSRFSAACVRAYLRVKSRARA
jgi:uncharacterized protein (DUF58 family)